MVDHVKKKMKSAITFLLFVPKAMVFFFFTPKVSESGKFQNKRDVKRAQHPEK
jgi:hypothetical protein